jgi:cellulose synthase/poly-beta-1,6-N-acetylglucosamine synthase-like glycosyltransferase
MVWVIALCLLGDSLLRFLLLCLRMIKAAPPPLPQAAGFKAILLIAARNEAGTIGPTIEALIPSLSEWPSSRLWVVADHCTDETTIEAARAGAYVACRDDGRLGKGAVIDWWLAHHEDVWRSATAVIILDADSRIAPDSLRALGNAIAAGADAAQAFIAPRAQIVAGRLAGWSEVLMQRIDDEARRRMTWPVPLRGTGMAIRAPLLAQLAPRLHTLAEDLELDAILAARRARVDFVPEAIVWDPKPNQSAGVSRQRARWLQGQFQVMRDYWRELLKALATSGAGAWMLIWLLFLRPKVAFIGLRAMAAGLLLILFGGSGPWLMPLIGLALDVAYYLGGAAVVDEPRRYLLDLFAAPRYLALWLYSLGLAIIKRGWLRAGRGNAR